MSKEAILIENYLKNNCSDFWNVIEHRGIIICNFLSELKFTVQKDDTEHWNITGQDISMNIIYNIALLLNENY